jgi:hypothetical protein
VKEPKDEASSSSSSDTAKKPKAKAKVKKPKDRHASLVMAISNLPESVQAHKIVLRRNKYGNWCLPDTNIIINEHERKAVGYQDQEFTRPLTVEMIQHCKSLFVPAVIPPLLVSSSSSGDAPAKRKVKVEDVANDEDSGASDSDAE